VKSRRGKPSGTLSGADSNTSKSIQRHFALSVRARERLAFKKFFSENKISPL
jgi:hypothetical protein